MHKLHRLQGLIVPDWAMWELDGMGNLVDII